MIVRYPKIPPMGESGHWPVPTVLLLGAFEHQNFMAQGIERSAGCVIKTSASNQRLTKAGVTYLDTLYTYMAGADFVVCWVQEGVYQWWLELAFLYGKDPTKLLAGIDPDIDFWKGGRVRFLLEHRTTIRLKPADSLESLVAYTKERCRLLRGEVHDR